VLSILTLLCVNAAFAIDTSSSYIDNSNSDALDTKLVSNNDASAPNTFKTNEKIKDNSDVKTSIDNTKTKTLTKNVKRENSSKKDVNLKRVAAGDAVTKKYSSTVSKKFTKSQIQTAANTLKSYVETKHTLPSSVSIGNTKVTMSDALYLLSKSVVNANSKNGYLSLISLNGPTRSTHYELKGKWYKSNITQVANNIVSFMNSNKRAPNYVTTSLGLMQFKSAVYYMARSVTFYKNNKRLPNYVTVNDAVFTTSSPKVASLKDIEKVASEVKTYVERNHKLPTTVIINNEKISMPEFLYLLCKKNIDTSNTNSKIIGLPDKTSVTNYNLKGTWDKNNLISVAKGILNFMSSNKRAPNYMHTSLGIMQFRSLVYYMARSVTFYESNNRLPNYVTVDDSVFTGKTNTNTNTNTNDNTNTNSQFAKYLKATKNCQVNSETIKNLANSITSGLKYQYSKAKAIFNWVRDKCDYSYYFNTNKGALTTLNTKSGNCCDLAHLVTAISRAAGIPTRYAHGTCVFRSGNVIGHVWAEVMVNGQWLKADASSNYNNFNEINNWNGVTMKGYYTELPF
jgi:hypothetical protein